MPKLSETEISCGIRQLSGLCRDSNVYRPEDKIPPKTVILEAFDANNDHDGTLDWDELPTKAADIRFGIVLFSDSIRRGNGKRLAAYIEKAGLGEVEESDVTYNPNTKREIQMWTWYLDREALVAWLKKNAPKKEPPEYSYIPRYLYIGRYE